VRRRSTGELEFLGRIDNQVKCAVIASSSAKLGRVLAQHESVRDAVVIVRKDQGDKHLAAYVVPREGKAPTANELREFLSERLPSQMVPSLFVVLEELPLSANGKIDRAALPAINGNQTAFSERCVLPQDKLELKLQRIWEKVLSLSPIGMDDNFLS